MTRWRRDLHAHPELGFDEHRTAQYLAATRNFEGQIAACQLSEQSGACDMGLADRVKQHVHAVGLPYDLNKLSQAIAWNCETLKEHMLHDKKTDFGQINFVLLHDIGGPFVSAEVPAQALDAVLGSLGAR